jgi:lipoate-protein ligase A
MQYCDISLTEPAKTLAFEEALLDACEAGETDEVLHFWEPITPFLVLGYANRYQREVNLDYCRSAEIPVLRRCSGGGTVLQAPGCLNYSLTLRISRHPALESITGANGYVMERNALALSGYLSQPVSVQGHTDLSIHGLKFSGNAQRRKKDWLLFHGCLLLAADIELIANTLQMPSSQPDYRKDRPHREFLRNLEIPAARVKECFQAAWEATTPLTTLPMERMHQLVESKYSRDDWNFSR